MTARIVPTALACLAMALVSACSSETNEATPNPCAGVAVLCDDRCVVTSADPSHCGACGNACDVGEACVDGACTPACPEGQVDCGGTCIWPDTDPNHCGASGDCEAENGGWICAVAESCVGGVCLMACPDEELLCDGRCIAPAIDRNHCGATGDCAGDDAGVACESNEQCVEGACKLVCPDGRIACEGSCISPDTSRPFCGASGDCLGENAGVACEEPEACVDGACTQPKCTLDSECGDGLFCNGTEICLPDQPGADAFGCYPGSSPCNEGVECNEETRSCS